MSEDAENAVLRVRWLLGTDHLLGTCHCGAQHRAQDPVALWDWLHAHPDHPRHRAAGRPGPVAGPASGPEEEPAP